MKRLVFLFLVLFSSVGIHAQNNSAKLAVLLSVSGEVDFERKGETSKLAIPQYFIENDQIEVQNGSVKIMYGSGDEKEFSSGITYKFLRTDFQESLFDNNESLLNIGSESHYMQSQSYSAFSLRGSEEEMTIFPLSSKVIDIENASILWKSKTKENIKLTFQIFLQNNDSLIWKANEVSNDEITLNSAPIKEGELYYWTCVIPDSDFEQLGMITVLDEEMKKNVMQFELNDKVDYLKAYVYYKQNEFWFDARNVIKKAMQEFPEIDLFKYILSTM